LASQRGKGPDNTRERKGGGQQHNNERWGEGPAGKTLRAKGEGGRTAARRVNKDYQRVLDLANIPTSQVSPVELPPKSC
jgi:hypothetical protein